LLENVLAVFWEKMFYIPHVFTKKLSSKLMLICKMYEERFHEVRCNQV